MFQHSLRRKWVEKRMRSKGKRHSSKAKILNSECNTESDENRIIDAEYRIKQTLASSDFFSVKAKPIESGRPSTPGFLSRKKRGDQISQTPTEEESKFSQYAESIKEIQSKFITPESTLECNDEIGISETLMKKISDLKPLNLEFGEQTQTSSSTPPLTPKSTRFNSTKTVYLIPSNKELKDLHIKEKIWWNAEDLYNFRYDANIELKKYCKEINCRNYHLARSKLYQPMEVEF